MASRNAAGWTTVAAAVLAMPLLSGCGVFSAPSTLPADPNLTRPGVDRSAPAGLAGDRARARHADDAVAVDEARGQPVGSIVPPGSGNRDAPAAMPPLVSPASVAPAPLAPAPVEPAAVAPAPVTPAPVTPIPLPDAAPPAAPPSASPTD